MSRFANRKDDNHKQIVDDLIKIGFSVIDQTPLKDRSLDILVSLSGKTALVEIKNGKNDLEESQRTIFRTWQGKTILARCTGDILAEFELIKKSMVCCECGNTVRSVYYCESCNDWVKVKKVIK